MFAIGAVVLELVQESKHMVDAKMRCGGDLKVLQNIQLKCVMLTAVRIGSEDLECHMSASPVFEVRLLGVNQIMRKI